MDERSKDQIRDLKRPVLNSLRIQFCFLQFHYCVSCFFFAEVALKLDGVKQIFKKFLLLASIALSSK